MISKEILEIELKKRGWEQYLDFAVAELNRGVPPKNLYYKIAEKDVIEFEKNLTNPQKRYLPISILNEETEFIFNAKEKIEGEVEVRGNAKITPNCHVNQHPIKDKNKVSCVDNPP